MYFQSNQDLPKLIPIRKKQQSKYNLKDKDVLMGAHLNSPSNAQKKEIKPQQQQVKTQKTKREQPKILSQRDLFNIGNKFQLFNHKSTQSKDNQKLQRQKMKEMQQSKLLINEMMHKLNVRNISQQLNPITQQNLQQQVQKMNEQIQKLNEKAQQKKNSLQANSNNQHIKQQIEDIEIAINRCTTIRNLYNDKVNLRAKIAQIQRNNLQLKQQNTKMRIKISKDIDAINRHTHNLPCQKEKQLQLQMKTIKNQLDRQRQMRINLQKNVGSVMLGFQRLYKQAQSARMVVVSKLKQIQMAQAGQDKLSLPKSDLVRQQSNKPVQMLNTPKKSSNSSFIQQPKKRPANTNGVSTNYATKTPQTQVKAKRQQFSSLEQQMRKLRGTKQSAIGI